MTSTGSLYIDLILRMRKDAADALNAYLAAKGNADEQVTLDDIVTRLQEDGHYLSFAKRGLLGYAGEPSRHELEAICTLIERARKDTEALGAHPTPHVLVEVESAREVITAYRKAFQSLKALLAALATGDWRAAVGEMRKGLQRLDAVAETDEDLAGALRLLDTIEKR